MTIDYDIDRFDLTGDDDHDVDDLRDSGDLCIACGYWVPTVGALCEICADEDGRRGS